MTDRQYGDYFKFIHHFNNTLHSSDDKIEMIFSREFLPDVVEQFKYFLLAIGYSPELIKKIQYIDNSDNDDIILNDSADEEIAAVQAAAKEYEAFEREFVEDLPQREEQVEQAKIQQAKSDPAPITTNIVTETDAQQALDALALGDYSDELKEQIKKNIYKKFGNIDYD